MVMRQAFVFEAHKRHTGPRAALRGQRGMQGDQ